MNAILYLLNICLSFRLECAGLGWDLFLYVFVGLCSFFLEHTFGFQLHIRYLVIWLTSVSALDCKL